MIVAKIVLFWTIWMRTEGDGCDVKGEVGGLLCSCQAVTMLADDSVSAPSLDCFVVMWLVNSVMHFVTKSVNCMTGILVSIYCNCVTDLVQWTTEYNNKPYFSKHYPPNHVWWWLEDHQMKQTKLLQSNVTSSTFLVCNIMNKEEPYILTSVYCKFFQHNRKL